MKENVRLSGQIGEIIRNLESKPAEIGVAVIDLAKPEPEIAGFNMDCFIYPASIYKVFIAAEILRQADVGDLNLDDEVEIKSPNDVDKDDPRFFPKNTSRDHRPLLRVGNRVTVDYLLDLMLTRSDNTASNVLMDLANRESINENIILPNGWQGSEVTRKFLDRLKEEKEYRVSKITVSNARHLAEFFYKLETGKLVNSRISERFKEYMQRRKPNKWRSGLYLPGFKEFYSKGGWLEINEYKWNVFRGIKKIREGGNPIIRYSGDAGIIKGEKSHYAMAVLTISKSKWPWVKFKIEDLSKKVYKLMEDENISF